MSKHLLLQCYQVEHIPPEPWTHRRYVKSDLNAYIPSVCPTVIRPESVCHSDDAQAAG